MKRHAIIIGISRYFLTEDEKKYLTYYMPLGVILFTRNILNKKQVKDLISSIKNILGKRTLILIDQEGGKVNRLNTEIWPEFPAASIFGKLAEKNLVKAKKETFENYKAIGKYLSELGINVNCAPVLDLFFKNASSVIGSRAFSAKSKIVIELAKQACKGLFFYKILPVIKHIPGHGRAKLDSHLALPEIKLTSAELSEDFSTFKALNYMPAAMTAHIKFSKIDKKLPVTLSSKIILEVIRKQIGFTGVLFSDDICMKALKGPYFLRAYKALNAGCDLILHCDGNITNTIKSTLGAGAVNQNIYKKLRNIF